MNRPPEQLAGQHVRLVRWRAADADWALDLVRGASDHLRAFLPWVDGYNAEQNTAYLKSCEANWNDGSSYQYSIWASGRPVGSCGLTRREDLHVMEIGYWLHPDHTGNGFASDSVRTLVKAAFEIPETRSVEIIHDAHNLASEAVPRRLGFTRIGTRKSEPPLPPADSGTEVIWAMPAAASES
ncbi:GNAT family N-acetyltransferase [Streptomyces sp. 3211]